MIVALPMFPNPHFAASSLISAGLPSKIRSATSSVKIILAAFNVRSSVPSGRTIRWRFAFARTTIWLIKLSIDILNIIIKRPYNL